MFAEREKFIKFHPDIESKIIYTSQLYELIVGSCEKKENIIELKEKLIKKYLNAKIKICNKKGKSL